MYVLGTAGHVDHGKSTLVQALTGIDPDRLFEEKQRGMTIDLGFAWLTLPSGREISIVDVPGHERFIKNMLAGVGGIDLALLVIAADEGVMPQTREHLAILDLLNVSRGLVAITKKDMVDEEMLELVMMDVEEALEGTALEGVQILETSATTGEGLPELLGAIDALLDDTPPRRDIGKPRLPIDRVFTMKGFGTVVTGTLVDGNLSVGQEIEILPPGIRTTIRGIQSHRKKSESVSPGNRVAVNLTGVSVDELQRGFVLTSPGWLKPTRVVDVRFRAVSDLAQPIGHNKSITFHTGASEVPAKMRLLDQEKIGAGQSGWAQIFMTRSLAVSTGDLFIIRSSTGTIGGGTVVDIETKRHKRFQTETIEKLELRAKGSPEEVLLATLEANDPQEARALFSQSSLSAKEAEEALDKLVGDGRVITLGSEGEKALLFSIGGWNKLITDTKQALQGYHQQFPIRSGAPKEELRSRLKLPAQHFNPVLQRLSDDALLVEEGKLVRLPSHKPSLTPKQQAEADSFLKNLSVNPFSPSVTSLPDIEILNLLIKQEQVVKMSDNVFFTVEAYQKALKEITDHIKAKGSITVAEVRDKFNTSRKYALALMEYLDDQKITRRQGDERILR